MIDEDDHKKVEEVKISRHDMALKMCLAQIISK